MSDPIELLERIDAAADAFGHAHGRPTFEPELNAAPDADDGEVQTQKACRLLELTNRIDDVGDYYGAILEHSFIIIEHTFQGYLLAVTGTDVNELRNHTSPYEFAKGQVPLEDETIDSLKALYDARRTEHYYGTTVTTEAQVRTMRSVAATVHERVVTFDHDIEQFCLCSSLE
ncbi:DNA-binding protein [Natrinema sp. CBA1119]|uniref:DNA-binding protein n=1 Tax=Natrinema sp. CBA1119 TaxID=1608465 RepID=UPI000BF97604|nr:DNA-binding protein [Natrinema sp. CBA1119]PGF14889.1 DNA-binding protein [Natrinema sp. CBA1119]